MTQSNYTLAITIIAAITMVLWIWQAVIKVQENRSWHSYGCLVYALSYGVLIWVDIDIYKIGSNAIVDNDSTKVYFATILQLGATISFLIFTYTKDHAKNDIRPPITPHQKI